MNKDAKNLSQEGQEQEQDVQEGQEQEQDVQEETIGEEKGRSEDANLLEALNKQQSLIEEQAQRIEILTKEVAMLVKNGGNVASAHIEKSDNTFENSLNAQTKDYVSLRDLDFTIDRKAYLNEE